MKTHASIIDILSGIIFPLQKSFGKINYKVYNVRTGTL